MPGPKRIHQGQALAGLPASGWNAFVDTHEKVRQWRGQPNGQASSAASVLVLNDSGAEAGFGKVVALGETLNFPADRAGVVYEGVTFKADIPNVSSRAFAVLKETLADGAIGGAEVPCAAWARVNMTDESHWFCGPLADYLVLQSNGGSFYPILWKETGTGEKWAIVSLIETGSFLHVQVENEGGLVLPSDLTFTCGNVKVFAGRSPREQVTDEGDPVFDGDDPVYESGVVAVNFNEELLINGDWLWIAHDRSGQRWIPDRIGTRLFDGVVTSTISAATGFGTGGRGSGLVQFKHPDSGDDIGSPMVVANIFRDAYPENAVGRFDGSCNPPEVVSIGCTLIGG